MDADLLLFGPFSLDIGGLRLLQGDRTIPLPPKALAALIYMAGRQGRLIGKDELLDAVWGHRFVSQGVLKNTITTLRQALGDDPKMPLYIETVHRLGYRFIAETKSSPNAELKAHLNEAVSPPWPAASLLVGRGQALTDLVQLFEMALRGESQIVFVSGEPGIGKTTLIQTFAAQAATLAQTIQGQCVAQFGQNEPYLPLLEAINVLTRVGGADVCERLRRYAPTWLAQMPWLMNDLDREQLQRETQGATKDRMLRELGEFLLNWTTSRPLILIVEDIHWSDRATLDAINYLARRRNGARLMLLGSYRSAEVAVNQHPFLSIRNELSLHGLCRDLALEALSESDVSRYLHQRFPEREITDDLALAVFRRSEGLPLFFARIADEMETLPAGGDEKSLLALPEGLKQLVEHQLERFPGDERQWLDIAAVCGEAFSAEAVAGAGGDTATDVENWCETLVRARHVLKRCDRQAELSYRFIHAYYQELAYDRIPPSRKTVLHAAIAAWYETNLREKAGEKAAELAEHFERGGQYERASYYLYQAALNALHRHAAFEASELLQRGLRLLDEYLPDEPEYARRKLDYLTLLPAALVATNGYAVPELEALYRRALALADQFSDTDAQFITLYWMWLFHTTLAKLDTALDTANRLFIIAEMHRASSQLLTACYAIGTTHLFRGELVASANWFGRGLDYVADTERTGGWLAQVFGHDPVASLFGKLAITRQMLGYGESIFEQMQQARERSDQLGIPYTQILVGLYVCWLHKYRREPERISEQLPGLERMAETHGFPILLPFAQIYRVWLAAGKDDGYPSNVDAMARQIETLSSAGTILGLSLYRIMKAEIHLLHGNYQAALRIIEDGMAKMRLCGEYCFEPEFWLLRGDVLRHQGATDHETIKGCFETALSIAESQSARFLTLRAACRLLELAESGEEQSQATRRLQDIYAQFSEGFETPDLRDAKALLDRLVPVEATTD